MPLFTTSELENLNWWRGFLAFIVFISHIGEILWAPVTGAHSTLSIFTGNAANLAVVFFFSISGAMIALSGLNHKKNNAFDWKGYLINRIVRIFPAFLFSLILCILLYFIYFYINNSSEEIVQLSTDITISRNKFSLDLLGLVKSFFMIQPGIRQINAPLWSLFMEWWLYVSALFIFLCLSTPCTILKRITLITLSLLCIYLCFYDFGMRALFYVVIWYFGFIFTIYFKNKKNTLLPSISIAFILLIIIAGTFGISSFNILKSNYILFGIIQICYSVIFINLSLRFSGKYFFEKCANYSYTLYIIHFPLTLFAFALTHTYIKNNIALLSIASFLLLLTVPLIAKTAAFYVENKSFFKKKILSVLNYHSNKKQLSDD